MVNNTVLNFSVSKGRQSVEFHRPDLEVGIVNNTVMNFSVSKRRGVGELNRWNSTVQIGKWEL